MNPKTTLFLAALLAAPVLAQNPPMSFVDLDVPTAGLIVVMHPARDGAVFLDGGGDWGACDLRLGRSPWNQWGDCWFAEPALGAESLIVQAIHPPDGLVVLDTPLPLEAPPDAEGRSSLDLAHLRGGGHADEPLQLLAWESDHTWCALWSHFWLTLRSPDINGDLRVDLTDIAFFTQALAEYRAYADLHPDGRIDLSDVVVMVQALPAP